MTWYPRHVSENPGYFAGGKLGKMLLPLRRLHTAGHGRGSDALADEQSGDLLGMLYTGAEYHRATVLYIL